MPQRWARRAPPSRDVSARPQSERPDVGAQGVTTRPSGEFSPTEHAVPRPRELGARRSNTPLGLWKRAYGPGVDPSAARVDTDRPVEREGELADVRAPLRGVAQEGAVHDASDRRRDPRRRVLKVRRLARGDLEI